MERIRSVEIVITVDTNKRTLQQPIEQREDESVDEMLERAGRVLRRFLSQATDE